MLAGIALPEKRVIAKIVFAHKWVIVRRVLAKMGRLLG
jgi:hypothetical protein